MTDKEKMIQLFTEIGVHFEIFESGEAKGRDFPYTIELDQGIGYEHFFCEFFFDKDGRFVAHGIWE